MTQAYLEIQDIHEPAIANNSLDALHALYEYDLKSQRSFDPNFFQIPS